MKHETRIQALKNQQRSRSAAAHAPATERRPWLSRRTQIVLTAILSAAVTYWLLDNVILTRLPTAILGKWEVTQGELEGFTMEFFRNGSMRSRIINEGQVYIIDANAQVDDDMLEETTYAVPDVAKRKSVWQTFVNLFTSEQGAEQTIVRRIVGLTPTQLVLENQDGRTLKLERRRQ
jgi:hypothetical protein